MSRSGSAVCYLEGSRHRFVAPVIEGADEDQLRVCECAGIRGRIHDGQSGDYLFSGAPPAEWTHNLQAPVQVTKAADIVDALRALAGAAGGRCRLHYSSTDSRRLTLTRDAAAPLRTFQRWAVTGWIGRPDDDTAPLGWSGAGDGLAWMSGAAASEIAWLAKALSNAGPTPVGEVRCLLGPAAAAVVVHEAIGHRAEAPNTAKYPERGVDRELGRYVAAPSVSADDDPLAADGPAHYEYDDDNVRVMGATPLIRAGVLVGRLHSATTAASACTLPTANGRAASAWDRPLARVSNLICRPGTITEDEALAEISAGLYIHRLANGLNNGAQVQGTIVLAERICRGRRTGELLTGGRISEDLALLRKVVHVADNPAMHASGLCGKAGQILYDVGTCAPSMSFSALRIVP